jgi:glycosyltransferase involved in cell wall biosynthesis
MPAFDVFCLSSRYEGMTYVLLEALAAGLPIVATNVGGVSLCVADGANGLVVEPGDTHALADALLRVAQDRETQARYARASMQKARSFNLDRMVESTLKIYERAIATRR